tara:strand:- start:376 stop:525 length:150 start_codon:yes stop_codon:yes gene_type:complete
MNYKKIFIWIAYVLFCVDFFIDGKETNYNAWIIIFLFYIALNTVKKDEN